MVDSIESDLTDESLSHGQCLGSLWLPLKDAVYSTSHAKEDQSSWVALSKEDGEDDCGHALALLYSFNVLSVAASPTAPFDRTPNEVVQSVPVNDASVPVLQADKGYFLLGPEESANTLFFFSVLIPKVKTLNPLSKDKIFFSYFLFGNKICTDEFIAAEDYCCEQASVKILSNVKSVVTFFKDTTKNSPFRIYLNSATYGQVAHTETDWSKFLLKDGNQSISQLESGERLSFF